jgi:hypothetical protein
MGEDVLTSWLVPSSTDALSDVASTKEEIASGELASPVGALASEVGVLLSRTGPPLSVDGVGGLLLLEHAANNARIPVNHTFVCFIVVTLSMVHGN